jgi:hypothetical protein
MGLRNAINENVFPGSEEGTELFMGWMGLHALLYLLIIFGLAPYWWDNTSTDTGGLNLISGGAFMWMFAFSKFMALRSSNQKVKNNDN